MKPKKPVTGCFLIKHSFKECDHWSKIGKACDLFAVMRFRIKPNLRNSFQKEFLGAVELAKIRYERSNRGHLYNTIICGYIIDMCNFCLFNKNMFKAGSRTWILPAAKMVRDYFKTVKTHIYSI